MHLIKPWQIFCYRSNELIHLQQTRPAQISSIQKNQTERQASEPELGIGYQHAKEVINAKTCLYDILCSTKSICAHSTSNR